MLSVKPLHGNWSMAAFFLCMWLVPVAFGVRYLNDYGATPGIADRPVPEWPIDSRIDRIPGMPVIVMALHAGCPCSRASVLELRKAVERSRSSVHVEFLIYRPKGLLEIQQIPEQPGTHARYDDEGRELAKFHAKVSGEVWMYGGSGALQFHGGVTGARGHEGSNTGSEILSEILRGAVPRFRETPVFGCSLLDRRDR